MDLKRQVLFNVVVCAYQLHVGVSGTVLDLRYLVVYLLHNGIKVGLVHFAPVLLLYPLCVVQDVFLDVQNDPINCVDSDVEDSDVIILVVQLGLLLLDLGGQVLENFGDSLVKLV